MTAIDTRIWDSLRNNCRIETEDRILLGVSGGMDSIFLLYCLHKMGQPVTAAVFNHGLREEAAEECDFVESFCAERNIPCMRGGADAASFAAQHKLGTEEAARELRYRFLFESAAACGAAAVATAHHANDQAETVLLHILRGSGVDGLCGMRPYALPNAFSDEIPLIRPMLSITREEISTAALDAGLEWREDRSNSNLEYTRNRIRQDLLPKLAADYNPRIVSSLCRLAENAAADNEMLDDECEKAIRYAAFYKFETCCEWSRRTYLSYLPGMRRRMLRRILSLMGVDLSGIDYLQVKLADSFFMNARFNQTFPFIDGIWLCCEGDKALILTQPDRKQWKYPQISQGWTLYCETSHIMKKDLPEWIEKARTHPEIAVLDANQLASVPVLRTICPGERFEPFGCSGSQKLSDFLINNKVPVQYRRDLVVAADNVGIVWVPGLRVSNRCALNEGSHRIMILKLKEKQVIDGQ